MKICVGCGHGLATDYGATGILDESKETRKVQDVVIKYLQLAGQNVLKTRIDYPSSVNQSLAYRVNQSDNWGADVYVEIHLNCGGGHGTETFCVGNGRGREIAQRIVNNIASLGYTNRGVKDGSRLYAVRRPQASSVLVECCFVDSQEDANRWNVESIGKAIAEGILGHSIATNNTTTQINPTNADIKRASDFLGNQKNIMKIQYVLKALGYKFNVIDGICGRKTTSYIGQFQKKVGLNVDYCFGNKTMAKAIEKLPLVEKGSIYLDANNLLQFMLGIKPDHYIGNISELAIQKFQREHGLGADGKCGKKTWTKLLIR